MIESFKRWAWTRPTYDAPFWEKLDQVVDNGLEKAFDNVVGRSLVSFVDKCIDKFENLGKRLD